MQQTLLTKQPLSRVTVPTDPSTPLSSSRFQPLNSPSRPSTISAKYARVPTSPGTPRSPFVKSPSELSAYSNEPDSGGVPASLTSSMAEKYALPSDPYAFGQYLYVQTAESDDIFHNDDPKAPRDSRGTIFTARGFANIGCMAILLIGILALFTAYPIVTWVTSPKLKTKGGFNVGGINSTGTVPDIGNFGLIDLDTPQELHTKPSYVDGSTLQLVFSDEFNQDGRSFYPGDDPYWEAVNLHYWQTDNLEWYDPSSIITSNGSLRITLSKKENHNLSYTGGMMSTWNKFCFTGGLLETSVVLPGISNVAGLWPAVWTMGNLGRAGYGASLEGLWPYSYDTCDVGTVKNQTINSQPPAGVNYTNPWTGDEVALSYLPGQRLSRCTCPGESHPGPVHEDHSYVGRASPEIDVFEAQVLDSAGILSQSAQWAPFDDNYNWDNTSISIQDPTITAVNTYRGAYFQEATSSTTETNDDNYELGGGNYYVHGFEYLPGFDTGYITWIANGKASWTLHGPAVGANNNTQIGPRAISQEPMYIIVNLGMSYTFGEVDLTHLTFPTTLSIDYVRVYQRQDSINVGCDPADFPTADYINTYTEAYNNPLLTTWVDDYGQPFPKNNLLTTC